MGFSLVHSGVTMTVVVAIMVVVVVVVEAILYGTKGPPEWITKI